MFEVRVMCVEKKLSELLWSLDGKIVGQPVILPVRGAKAVNGVVREGGGGLRKAKATTFPETVTGKVIQSLLATKATSFRWHALGGLIQAAGGSPKSESSVLLKMRQLKVTGYSQHGTYRFNRARAQAALKE